MGIELCTTIELPVVADPQGDLAFAERDNHVPFEIARVFYVYDVPAGATRGGHAHRTLEQVVFCVAGRLEIVVDDGERSRPFVLDDPRRGLYLPPMVWHDIGEFEAGTVYLVLASQEFDEGDYVRDRDEFLAAVRAPARDA
ncbi:MAG TPA: FdtA/QdtA family cupin domain-containing protein [Solirubrobacterales bacterium]|jgi:dTDP-4-dehydrorhamnose 3,5-epimerase-like enzyme|nr:FdtA/QdtA family cupin domain-containing protein [Solirubrobacterales bacterium]